MTALTDDRAGSGLVWALVSAASFGLSGTLARGLMDAGWSPGAAVTVRVAVGGLALLPLAVRSLRGRWRLLRANAGHVLLYGVVAVAACQVAYFYATRTIPVGVALLLEYTAPLAVVGWVWATRGERPQRLTVAGALVAMVGLVLVLDLTSTTGGLALVGVAWALVAMVGAACYFVLSADDSTGLPPVALACSGLVVAAVLLALLGEVGVLPFSASTGAASYAGLSSPVPFWLPLALLGLVSAAAAYLTGIEAGRRLGSRTASFVALGEVLFAMVFAWLLLDELPRAVQLLGGLLVLAGVVLVKVDGRTPALAPEPGAFPVA